MGQRWGPVVDLEVAPDVQRLLGGELAVRELFAQLTGPVWCQRCHREINLATTPASPLAKASDPDVTATGGLIRVAFTHASCVRSQAIIERGVDQRFQEDADTDVTVVCGLRPARPARSWRGRPAAPTSTRSRPAARPSTWQSARIWSRASDKSMLTIPTS